MRKQPEQNQIIAIGKSGATPQKIRRHYLGAINKTFRSTIIVATSYSKHLTNRLIGRELVFLAYRGVDLKALRIRAS